MNIVAVDIGNKSITIALYLKGQKQFIKSVSARSRAKLTEIFKSAREKIPLAKSSKDQKRDGAIVGCSVKPTWSELVQKLVKDNLDEKIPIIGKQIPLPMTLWVDEPEKVGTDPIENYKAIRGELEQYSHALAQKPEVIVANKIDLDPDGKIVDDLRKKLNKEIYPISAVTGAGIKELRELLWQKVKEIKS
jgi:hypothetical protein